MLDFNNVAEQKAAAMNALAADLTRDDLRDLTNEMIDKMLAHIAHSTDADVVFKPYDPNAYDEYAEREADKNLAWTLGHVIVHTTASAEESAAMAASLARGVIYKGRTRYEVPWETVTTIAQCRHRLEESRRMRLASLDMWPDEPHLNVTKEAWPGFGEINATGRFLMGLWHDDQHEQQIAAIVKQAQQAREAVA